jgi:CRISPR-associated protein Csm1
MRKWKIIKAIKTYWMITYDLSRMCSRISDLSVRNMINCCKTEVCTNNGSLNGQPIETDYHLLELWAMACRWAELEIRQKSSNNV